MININNLPEINPELVFQEWVEYPRDHKYHQIAIALLRYGIKDKAKALREAMMETKFIFSRADLEEFLIKVSPFKIGFRKFFPETNQDHAVIMKIILMDLILNTQSLQSALDNNTYVQNVNISDELHKMGIMNEKDVMEFFLYVQSTFILEDPISLLQVTTITRS